MLLSKNEFEVLRNLATQYMDIATLSIHKEKRDLWKSLNRSKMQRPMVVIDQLPFNELNGNQELTMSLSDPFWRNVEWELRSSIYRWKHFPVDMVLEPFIKIPKIIHNSGYGLNADVERRSLDEGTSAPSQHYNNVLKDYDDIEKIKDTEITLDKELSELMFAQATDIFKGVAPITQSHGISFNLGVWDYLNTLMGMENILIDMYDRPEFLHACMERVTSATIAGIQMANELGVHDDISNTCHCSYVYTDELLPDFGKGRGATSDNCWAFGLAQLFSSASPHQFEEFEVPYVSRMAEQFGMVYYGCCDVLDDRLDMVKNIPNVKKVSCSPWSNRKRFAERIGDQLIMSNKPTPAYLATDSVDWDLVRDDLKWTVDLAKSNNVNLEIILKDISTVKYEPERFTKWAEIAMDVVNSF